MQKKFHYLISCLTIFVFTGCSTARHFNYGVEVRNKGAAMILVEPFQLTDGPDSSVDVGDVYPNNGKAMTPFYARPFQHLTITWNVPATGVRGQAQVQLNLPKKFTKEMGNRIYFYIYPEEQRVEVAYNILDPKTGQESVIRQ